MSIKNAYDEVEAAIEKHGLYPGLLFEMKSLRNRHELKNELEEAYGIIVPVSSCHNKSYIRIDDARYISILDGVGRKISWPDDGGQPDGEMLFVLQFSTGAYSLAEDYPRELFDEFFEALKALAPKYSDTHNHALYFEMKDAAHINSKFTAMFSEYKDRAKKEFRAREAKRLEEKAAKLREES